jgi:hypothetical protein
MRVIVYNPLFANNILRLEAISLEFEAVDIVILIAIQFSLADSELSHIVITLHKHWAVIWPAGKNHTTGIAILFKYGRFHRKQIVQRHDLPTSLKGRCAGVRIACGHHDISGFGLYFPVVSNGSEKTRAHVQLVQDLTQWQEHHLSKLVPFRSLPIIGLDAKDGMGFQKRNGEWISTRSTAIGGFAQYLERVNGARLRILLETHELAAANTFIGGGHTYFHHTGHSSMT